MTAYLYKLWILIRSRIDKITLRFGFKLFGVDKRYALNPMLKYPRNIRCWCGSKYKAKHCCLPYQARIVPVEMVNKLSGYMKYINGRYK